MRSVSTTRCRARPYRFTPPFGGGDYALLLYVTAVDVSPEEQTKISEAIVASGCRYAVCYGHRCSSWDDSIDLASIDAGKEEDGFVMTTWHESDTPQEVVDFFWHNTSFDDFSAERMGIFILGADSQVDESLEIAVRSLNAETG